MTKNQNYNLKDVLGVTMDRSFPLHKLKIVHLESPLPFDEFHKIISHKVVNDTFLMLVSDGTLWFIKNGLNYKS